MNLDGLNDVKFRNTDDLIGVKDIIHRINFQLVRIRGKPAQRKIATLRRGQNTAIFLRYYKNFKVLPVVSVIIQIVCICNFLG